MNFNSLGLLILRVGFGLMLAFQHGLPKLLDFSNKMHSFPDPLRMGSKLSLIFTVGAELLCALAVALGIFTRLCAVLVTIVMGVAIFIIHTNDPLAKKEMALLYFFAFSAICAYGPGAFSIDAIFRRVR